MFSSHRYPKSETKAYVAPQVINDLDKKSTVADDKDEAVLSKSIQKVATLARELYLPCSQQLRKLLEANNHERKVPMCSVIVFFSESSHVPKWQEEPCDENYKWENPPDGAVNRLRRDCCFHRTYSHVAVYKHFCCTGSGRGSLSQDCAINLGVLLPGILPHKSGETSKSDVWRFARRNSHMRNRQGLNVVGGLVSVLQEQA